MKFTIPFLIFVAISAFTVVLPAQAPTAHPDIPYTAFVSRDEARFVFPLPHRDRWEFGGIASQEVTEFEWSVEIENDSQRYRFGIFVTKAPDGRRTTSQQPAAFFGRGRAFVTPPGGETVAVPEAHLYERPGGWPEARDENRFAITIDDPATLRLLFYARPSHAVFREILPDQPTVTHEVAIAYGVYDAEKPAPRIKPTWAKTYEAAVRSSGRPEAISVVLAGSGRCAAIANAGIVDILDAAGQTLWQWDYSKTNRFITAGSMALSPACDQVAIAGNSGYRYTWLASQRGRRIALHTTTTPLGIAFDRRGQLLAIGTGGSDVLLFTRAGELKWKTTLPNWCCVVQKLSFSKDNRSILVRDWGVAVLRVDGRVVWTGGQNGMVAADDLRTFVGWWEPNHGTGIGQTMAMNESGESLWSKYSSWTGAVISATGDRIVARINENQNPTEEDGAFDADRKTSLQILARNGDLLGTLPVKDGTPIAMSPDGERVILQSSLGVQGVDLRGDRAFEIPTERFGFRSVMVSEDARVLLIFNSNRNAQLQWFSLK